jgi:hypothetical protein
VVPCRGGGGDRGLRHSLPRVTVLRGGRDEGSGMLQGAERVAPWGLAGLPRGRIPAPGQGVQASGRGGGGGGERWGEGWRALALSPKSSH